MTDAVPYLNLNNLEKFRQDLENLLLAFTSNRGLLIQKYDISFDTGPKEHKIIRLAYDGLPRIFEIKDYIP